MVPAVIVPLAAIPRAISGKVDYRALPEVGAEAEPAERPHAPAGNALEFALTAIWEAVLGTRVGVADSFLDLGGDSLSGVRLASAVRLAFDVEIPIAALFDDAATVAGMASRIGAERARAV
jgi:acyl carrier protein